MADPHDTIDPQDLVHVAARIPRGLLRAAQAAERDGRRDGANTSELIRRGLALLAGVDPPVVRMGRPVIRVGRHERKDTP